MGENGVGENAPCPLNQRIGRPLLPPKRAQFDVSEFDGSEASFGVHAPLAQPPATAARRAGRMTGTTSAQDCGVLPVAVYCVSSCSHAPRSQPNRSERRPLSRRIGVLAHDSQPPRRRLRDRACAATGSMSCHTQHTVHDAGPPRD
jgi:hypothetical protein